MTWSFVDRLCLWHYHSNLIPLKRRDWHSLDVYHSTFIVQGIHFVLHQSWMHILTLVVRAVYATLRDSLPHRSNAVHDLIVRPACTMLTEPPQTVNLPYSASDVASCHPSCLHYHDADSHCDIPLWSNLVRPSEYWVSCMVLTESPPYLALRGCVISSFELLSMRCWQSHRHVPVLWVISSLEPLTRW